MENKEFKRFDWEQYKELLKHYNYTDEQIEEVKEVRETLDLMPFDMYQELVKQGVLVRTQKLKKPRSLYVNDKGQVLYLNHFYKKYNYIAFFKEDGE
jgi:hypothetical protein